MFSRGSSIVLSSNGSSLLCSRELSVSPMNGSRHLRVARLLGVTSAGRCYSLRDTHMQRLTPLSTLCCRRPVDALCRSCTILSGSKPGHLHTSSNISISVRCCHQVSLRITSKFSYFDPALTASGNMWAITAQSVYPWLWDECRIFFTHRIRPAWHQTSLRPPPFLLHVSTW